MTDLLMQSRFDRQLGAMSRLMTITLTLVGAGLVALWWQGRPGHQKVGYEAYKESSFEDAAKILERVVSASPDNHRARYYYALAQREIRHTKEAVEALRALVVAEDWGDRAWYQLIVTHLAVDQIADAKAEVENVPEAIQRSSLTHEAKALYYLRRVQDTEAQLVERLATSIGDRRARNTQSRMRRVLHADSKIYRASVDNLIAQLEQGFGFQERASLETMLNRGHREAILAYSSLTTAVEIADADPKAPEVARGRFELATILGIRGRDAEAEALQRRILAIEKERLKGDMYFDREVGIIQYATTEALAEDLYRNRRYRDALDLLLETPADEEGNRNYVYEQIMAKCLAELGEDDAMIALVDKWLAEAPTLPQMNYLRGKYHFDRAEYDKAIIFLERAHNRSKSSGGLNNLLARCYLELENYDQANTILEYMVDESSSDHEAQLMRVQAMEGLGWIDEARVMLTQLLAKQFRGRSSPGHVAIREYLDEFLTRYDLLPDDIYRAKTLYEEYPLNFFVGRRYLELLTQAKSIRAAGVLANDLEADCPADDPELYDVLIACARVSMSMGEYEQAAGRAGRAARVRPYEAPPYEIQAAALAALGRTSDAWDAIEKLEVVAPENAALPTLKFDLHTQEKHPQKAVAFVDALLAGERPAFETVRSAARALIAAGDIPKARKILARLRDREPEDSASRLVYGKLLLDVGDARGGERVLRQMVEANPENIGALVTVGRELFSRRLFSDVVTLVGPIVDKDPLVHTDLLNVLAQSYESLGDTHSYLDLLQRIHERGDRALAKLWAARFCAREGQDLEVLSIARAAQLETSLAPELVGLAARAALNRGSLPDARGYLRALRGHRDADEADIAHLEALVLEGEGRVGSAEEVLRKVIVSQPSRAAASRLALVGLLGRHRQIEALLTELTAAVNAKEVAPDLLHVAVRELIRADAPQARPVLTQTIESQGESATTLFYRGLLALADGEAAGALADLQKSFELAPTRDTGHACLLAAAYANDRQLMSRMVRPVQGEFPSHLYRDSPALADLIQLLCHSSAERTVDQARKLVLPTEGERIALVRLIEMGLANPEQRELLKRELPRHFVHSRYEFLAYSVATRLDQLALQLPEHVRTLKLMKARGLLRWPSSYTAGINIAASLLNDARSAALTDETALCIYAESYLRSGSDSALASLISYVLTAPGLPPHFYRDLAAILQEGGHPIDAARVLFTSPERNDAKTLAEAEALFRAGNVERAARLLAEPSPGIRGTKTYARIMAEYLGAQEATVRDAYTLASEAVYKHEGSDAQCFLTLARIAFKVKENTEARKNLERYLAMRPASARLVGDALDVVDPHADSNVAFRVWLEGRRLLLDPSGLIKKPVMQ